MMKLNLLLMAVCLVILSTTGCGKDGNKDWTEEVLLTVSSEVVEYYPPNEENDGFYGIKVREDNETRWTTLSMNGGIEGFDYEIGYEYRLKVLKIHLANPPADGSDFVYSLIKILSRTFVDSGEGETPVRIEGLTFDNYPRVDGSTSCRHLNEIIACKLLGVSYTWQEPLVNEWTVRPDYEHIPEAYRDFFWQWIKTSQTHGAFMNLIDGNADIILTHRTISPDEKARADELGITLTETPIAADAFAFVVNPENPVRSLTVAQIQDIYTGKITNWKQVGSRDAAIKVFTRPRNSGSEEVMRGLVMQGLEMGDFPESQIGSMAWVFSEVLNDRDAICYTFLNYKELIVRKPDSEVPKIAVNGIFPGWETVRDETYPFIAEVHVAVRSDLDRHSMAYRLYEWLRSPAARAAIVESGYFTGIEHKND
ncbi:MAG: substrate-binding domain-containing protein [Prevotellaceae bacterium]|jgi:phosphate transport system substrate-binding protein|nr:substrate-binding domain-containing protein [Prevotellaceae bacterium]